MDARSIRGRGYGEMLVGIGMLAVLALLGATGCGGIDRILEGKRVSVCAQQLKQLGAALKMYAAEHNGRYPPLASMLGDPCGKENRSRPTFPAELVFPKYLGGVSAAILVCPSDTENLNEGTILDAPCGLQAAAESSYAYFPWYATGRDMPLGELYATGLAQAYVAGVSCYDQDIVVDSGEMKGVLKRMDDTPVEGVDPAAVPLLCDLFDVLKDAKIVRLNHLPGGSNVLFLDGHIEFQRFSEKTYPVNEAMGRVFGAKQIYATGKVVF